ncbi:hypothetical protein [Parapedobacter sp. 2B3]|uniref:hypothetical protein n=1 Tax=Parapedobacter sp. 2B3 TaxID=3342381 RepID=UPI0035B59260
MVTSWQHFCCNTCLFFAVSYFLKKEMPHCHRDEYSSRMEKPLDNSVNSQSTRMVVALFMPMDVVSYDFPFTIIQRKLFS